MRVEWLGVSALGAAIVAIGLGIAALVLALDDRHTDQGPFALGIAGEMPGAMLPGFQAPGDFGEEFRNRFREFAPEGTPGATPETRAALGIVASDAADGPEVASVLSGSGAAQAGIQVGDVITAVDGEAVADVAALRAAIAEHAPGDTVRLTVQRGAESLEIPVTLTEPVVPVTPPASDRSGEGQARPAA